MGDHFPGGPHPARLDHFIAADSKHWPAINRFAAKDVRLLRLALCHVFSVATLTIITDRPIYAASVSSTNSQGFQRIPPAIASLAAPTYT